MCFQKHLLADIFGVMAVPGHIVGDPVHRYFVAIHNLTKGINASLPDTFDQDLVFERRFHCAMLCSGGCHFRWKTPLLPLEKAISQALAPVVTVSDGMIP